MTAAEWIRGARAAKGLTQALLGELVGASQVQISKWEHGRGSPGGDQLAALEAVLGVPDAPVFSPGTWVDRFKAATASLRALTETRV